MHTNINLEKSKRPTIWNGWSIIFCPDGIAIKVQTWTNMEWALDEKVCQYHTESGKKYSFGRPQPCGWSVVQIRIVLNDFVYLKIKNSTLFMPLWYFINIKNNSYLAPAHLSNDHFVFIQVWTLIAMPTGQKWFSICFKYFFSAINHVPGNFIHCSSGKHS
jgi:hypothetical protein